MPQLSHKSSFSSKTKFIAFVALFLVPIYFVLAILYGHIAILQTKPSKMAFQFARENPDILERVGSPTSIWIWPFSYYGFHGPKGDANIVLRIRGAKGRGRLEIQAYSIGQIWKFSKVVYLDELTGNIEKFEMVKDRGLKQNWKVVLNGR